MPSEKTIYKGKLLNLATKKVRLPNGYLARLEVIQHPGAALIALFLDKSRIIMLRQFRPVVNTYLYELPAGTLEKGESAFACAKREIIEETGYAAKKVTKIGYIYPVPGYSTEKIVIFKAENLKKQQRRAEADEVISHSIMTRRKVRRLFKRGRIVDAKTISALAMCGWL